MNVAAAELKGKTVKTLAEMAKKTGLPNWQSLRKEQLIRALVKQQCQSEDGTKAAKSTNGKKVNGKNGDAEAAAKARKNGKNGCLEPVAPPVLPASKPRSPALERKLKQIRARLAEAKDLAYHAPADDSGTGRDRLMIVVRDPYWLQVCWEIARASVERIRVAMGQFWHGAKPVLRLYQIAADGTTASSHRLVRQIEIHGGVHTWFIDVQDPPKSYQVEIGYVGADGRFFAMARSNTVTTPAAVAAGADRAWSGVAENSEHIYAMSSGFSDENSSNELRQTLEDYMRRPMGPSMAARYGLDAGPDGLHDLELAVDAELVLFGATESNVRVTVRGEPVRVEADGTFMVRLKMPDRRQVLPIIATADGLRQRTIIVAVERNTKILEPCVNDVAE